MPGLSPHLTASRLLEDELAFERSLWPSAFHDYVGQEAVIAKLKRAVEAARARPEPLEHTLLAGAPGLGKTSLAHVVAAEMGVPICAIAASGLERAGELAARLATLGEREILFIDDAHRLDASVEQMLCAALECGRMDLKAGHDPLSIRLRPFTLLAATPKPGLLAPRLRGLFDIVQRIDPYPPHDLEQILARSTRLLGTAVDAEAVREIAQQSRGTPRIANRLLRRVRDDAQSRTSPRVTIALVRESLGLGAFDEAGKPAPVHREKLLAVIDLALELKDKLPALNLAVEKSEDLTPEVRREQILAALENLGYARPDAELAAGAVLDDSAEAPLAELLRRVLAKLSPY